MESILRSIYQERASHPNTLGILMLERNDYSIPSFDTFDAILLIIVNEAEQEVFIKHYTYEEKKAAMHIVTEKTLREWLLLGSNRKIFDWLYNGKILYDRNEYITNLKTELREFPFYGRKVKMGLEFAKLIRRYVDGKAFFENQHYMDAYNHVIHSLHHLARLAIIEKGFHPEVTVWNQVKKMEPEIYKLYGELIMSEESIDKRLELLFLASEFLIHSKTNVGTSHLIEVLQEKQNWTFNEIMNHPELKEYSVDLAILLEYLVGKGLVYVDNVETKGEHIFHRNYYV